MSDSERNEEPSDDINAWSVSDLAHKAEREELMGLFAYGHLPDRVQQWSKPFGDLANDMVSKLGHLPTGQVNEGLKELLRAKDCFVRASLKLPQEG